MSSYLAGLHPNPRSPTPARQPPLANPRSPTPARQPPLANPRSPTPCLISSPSVPVLFKTVTDQRVRNEG